MSKLREWMVVPTIVCLSGCGSPEHTTIERFFLAARSNDSGTVAAMSAVSPPGPVESWQIIETSSQTKVPFALPELQRQLEDAEKIRDAQLEEGRNYLVDNREALDQIIPKLEEDSAFQFQGNLGEVQAAWSRLVDERRAKERAFQDMKRAVEAEIKLAEKSLMSEAAIERLDGEVAISEVMVMIQSPEAEEQPYAITLRKYELSGPESDRPEQSRWVIVDIEERSPT